jgi:hypothetical protein
VSLQVGSNQSLSFYKQVFAIAAIYDIVLGAAFILFYDPILEALDITAPDNTSYIHLSAVFVLVQGISYVFAWQDLTGNLGIVRVGVIYKAAYFLVALYYLVTDDLLHWVFFVFGVADLGFLLLFLGALAAMRSNRSASPA